MDVVIIFKLGNNRQEQQGGDGENRGIKTYRDLSFIFRSCVVLHVRSYQETCCSIKGLRLLKQQFRDL